MRRSLLGRFLVRESRSPPIRAANFSAATPRAASRVDLIIAGGFWAAASRRVLGAFEASGRFPPVAEDDRAEIPGEYHRRRFGRRVGGGCCGASSGGFPWAARRYRRPISPRILERRVAGGIRGTSREVFVGSFARVSVETSRRRWRISSADII
jgi:hypothetical protein